MLDTDSTTGEVGPNEALLRSEIGFWRELIESCGEAQPRDSVERMRQALALAETRLMHLFELHRQTGGAGPNHLSNVYHLHNPRSDAK
jgi:hypothetical protein